MKAQVKDALWIAGVAIVAIAVVNRVGFVRPYVTGEKKILGVI